MKLKPSSKYENQKHFEKNYQQQRQSAGLNKVGWNGQQQIYRQVRPQSAKQTPNYQQQQYQQQSTLQTYDDNLQNDTHQTNSTRIAQALLSSNPYKQQRSMSGQRSFEENVMILNKAAQQLNSLNSQSNLAEQYAFVEQNMRSMPRIIPQDKERLYSEALTLKTKINTLTLENTQLKTKNHQMDKELNRFRKQENAGNYSLNSSPYAYEYQTKMESPGHIADNLKILVKELKVKLAAQEEENIKMKKNLKFTKLQELEVENKILQEECVRLKELLSNELKEKMDVLVKETDCQKLEEQLFELSGESEQLRFDNREITASLSALQIKNKLLESQLLDLERKSTLQIGDLRKTLKQRDRDIGAIKNELAREKAQQLLKEQQRQLKLSAKKSHRSTDNMFNSATKPREQLEEIEVLRSDVKEKDQQISQLQSQLEQINQQFQLQQSQQMQYQNDGNDDDEEEGEFEEEDEDNEEEEEFDNEDNNRDDKQENYGEINPSQTDSSTFKKPNQQKIEDNYDEGDGEGDQEDDGEDELVQRELTERELLSIGETIRYRLICYRQPIESVSILLFDAFHTAEDLVENLSDMPFNLSKKSAQTLVRYLLKDDNQAGRIDNKVILEKFTDIVGPYKIFTDKQYTRLRINMKIGLSSKKKELLGAMKTNYGDGNDLNKEQLKELLENVNLGFQKIDIVFLIAELMKISPSIDSLRFRKFLSELLQNGQEEDKEKQEGNEYIKKNKRNNETQEVNYQDKSSNVRKLNGNIQGSNNNQVVSDNIRPTTATKPKQQRPQSTKRKYPQLNNQLEDENYEDLEDNQDGDDDDEEEEQEYQESNEQTDENDNYIGDNLNKNTSNNQNIRESKQRYSQDNQEDHDSDEYYEDDDYEQDEETNTFQQNKTDLTRNKTS